MDLDVGKFWRPCSLTRHLYFSTSRLIFLVAFILLSLFQVYLLMKRLWPNDKCDQSPLSSTSCLALLSIFTLFSSLLYTLCSFFKTWSSSFQQHHVCVRSLWQPASPAARVACTLWSHPLLALGSHVVQFTQTLVKLFKVCCIQPWAKWFVSVQKLFGVPSQSCSAYGRLSL